MGVPARGGVTHSSPSGSLVGLRLCMVMHVGNSGGSRAWQGLLGRRPDWGMDPHGQRRHWFPRALHRLQQVGERLPCGHERAWIAGGTEQRGHPPSRSISQAEALPCFRSMLPLLGHDALIAEADVLIVEVNAEHERIVGEARERSTGMVVVAQEKRAEVLQGLSSERSVLQKELEELHASERDHLARQKAYLEGQLIKLEQSGTDETG